jgi:hypothetical protein
LTQTAVRDATAIGTKQLNATAHTLQGAQVYGDVLSTAGSVTLQSKSLTTGNAAAGTTITNAGTINGASVPNSPTEHIVATPPPARPTPANPANNNWITGTYTYDPIKGDLTEAVAILPPLQTGNTASPTSL